MCHSGIQVLRLTPGEIPIVFRRNARARRYILRLDHQGRARVTIPRWGSAAEAHRFTERNRTWLEEQLRRFATQPRPAGEWTVGSQLLFRGEWVQIVRDETSGMVRIGPEVVLAGESENLRPVLETHLRKLARVELPSRVVHFARDLQLDVRRVSIRNQRSRWGSCSHKRTVSLNWRLVQAPQFVSDYIILHELMHLREMNHSGRFWRQVEQVCPGFLESERWLKHHAFLLNRD